AYRIRRQTAWRFVPARFDESTRGVSYLAARASAIEEVRKRYARAGTDGTRRRRRRPTGNILGSARLDVGKARDVRRARGDGRGDRRRARPGRRSVQVVGASGSSERPGRRSVQVVGASGSFVGASGWGVWGGAAALPPPHHSQSTPTAKRTATNQAAAL